MIKFDLQRYERALVALAKDQGSALTFTQRFTAAYNTSSREFSILFCLPGINCTYMVHIHTSRLTHKNHYLLKI